MTRLRAAVLLGLIAFIAVVAASPLAFTTIRVDGPAYDANCGTVFAGSGSWTFDSPYSSRPKIGVMDYHRKGEGAVTSAVEELMANADAGANAFDACQSAHYDRKILLGVIGVSVLATVGAAIGLSVTGNRRALT